MTKYFYDEETNQMIIEQNVDIRIAQMIAELEDEAEEEEEEEEKPKTSWRNKKRKQATCGKCGQLGHKAPTCTGTDKATIDLDEPINTPKPTDPMEDNPDPHFILTDDIKQEIKQLMAEGKNSLEIADYYNITIRTANSAMAKAKFTTIRPQ